MDGLRLTIRLRWGFGTCNDGVFGVDDEIVFICVNNGM